MITNRLSIWKKLWLIEGEVYSQSQNFQSDYPPTHQSYAQRTHPYSCRSTIIDVLDSPS